jgi:hypothetical protein
MQLAWYNNLGPPTAKYRDGLISTYVQVSSNIRQCSLDQIEMKSFDGHDCFIQFASGQTFAMKLSEFGEFDAENSMKVIYPKETPPYIK